MLRLIKVTGPHFTYTCLKCGERRVHADDVAYSGTYAAWADLNGEPFKAYYCGPCGNALRIQQDRDQAVQDTQNSNQTEVA